MGEMFAYYAACDVAFIGGSLLPLGGQNLIEACSLGKPVLIGVHTFNFMFITEEAVAAGAAMRVAGAVEMLLAAQILLADPMRQAIMAANAYAFALQHQGATTRTMVLVEDALSGTDLPDFFGAT